jgi:hypothetical protein
MLQTAGVTSSRQIELSILAVVENLEGKNDYIDQFLN